MALPLKSHASHGTTCEQRGCLDSKVNRGMQSTAKTIIEGGEGVREIHQPQPQLHYHTYATQGAYSLTGVNVNEGPSVFDDLLHHWSRWF